MLAGQKLGVVMDPIDHIDYASDSSLLMLLEAKKRGMSCFHITPENVYIRHGRAYAQCQLLDVFADATNHYRFLSEEKIALDEFAIILMRKDPPFDLEYIYLTYALELAEKQGTLVVNRPQALRDANEKVFISWFKQWTTDYIISRSARHLLDFVRECGKVVLKPLNEMQGNGIVLTQSDDVNLTVLLELLTEKETRSIMAQRYLPAIKTDGDRRIIIIDGKPIDYGLIRRPRAQQVRANVHAGGSYEGFALEPRHYHICEAIAPTLKAKGLICVGLDVIGDSITEINVTSPTTFPQIQQFYPVDIAKHLFDCLAKKL